MKHKIEIQYNGQYPNLCTGRLTVYIDDVKYVFPPYCMMSGGNIYKDDEGYYQTDEGKWEITRWPKDFPEHLKELILDKVNEEIPWGCCGGCS